MMPTVEQTKRRSLRVDHFVDRIRDDALPVHQVPPGILIDVLASALDERLITPEQVPAKVARLVALAYVKDTWKRRRNKAAETGTDAHELFEQLARKERVEVPEALVPHVAAFSRFVSDYQLTFLETEFSVFSPTYYYAGAGDFIATSKTHPEWGHILGDYKTSKSGIWPDIALQLAAIRYASFIGRKDLSQDHDTLKKIQTYIGVQITTEGYKVIPVNVTEGTFRVFLAATTTARWKRDVEQFALGEIPKEFS